MFSKIISLLVIAAIILMVAILVNDISFAIMKALKRQNFPKDCELTVIRKALPGEVMNILIPGAYQRPETAFEFIMDDLPGGIVAAKYRNTGWSAEETAEQIREMILSGGKRSKFRILTISVGDSVARYLEQAFERQSEVKLEVIAIDPCPNFLMLDNHVLSRAENVGLFAFWGCHLLGWLSIRPLSFLRGQGGNYSLALLDSWILQVAFMDIIENVHRTSAVLISQNDRWLSRAGIEDFFSRSLIIEVPGAAHADTVNNAKAYRDAIMQALERSTF